MSRPNNRSIFFGTVFAAIAALIILISFLPGVDKRALHTRGRFHPIGHLLAFASLSFVAVMTAKSFRIRILLILGAFMLGLGVEFVEHFIFRGAVEWPDVLMDWVGVLIGILLAIVFKPQADFLKRS